ncbi:MAG TPA: heme ABC transporter ATP-binding protein [Rhizomicrobium sp.]|jgi:iron complex transport system ATP-binding protein|nr:heme ABC transporter ATP-binding protein [Rhizomicrobium sp.]
MTGGLCARGVTVRFGRHEILSGVDIDVMPGEVTAVIGPNGAGKSTLLKVLAGDIVPQSGSVTLNGKPLSQWTAEERAIQRAVLPQTPELGFSFRAWDVVTLGRHPHRQRASRANNSRTVREAMTATDVAHFSPRECGTLSGGELHRVHYARTLAQLWDPLPDGRARILLLDEPTSSLDLFHQHAIMAKARQIAQSGAGVLAILHDLNLAAAYADQLLLLANGRVVAAGTPRDVLTAKLVTRVWRVPCNVSASRDGQIQISVLPHRNFQNAAE